MANNHIADDRKKVRLVDANEVERKLRLCIASWGRDCNSNAPVIARTFEDALQRVIHAPTVDAVEVVHGRWIRRGNEMKCSRCLFIYYSNHDDFNYCPNCGAKMDGDGNG